MNIHYSTFLQAFFPQTNTYRGSCLSPVLLASARPPPQTVASPQYLLLQYFPIYPTWGHSKCIGQFSQQERLLPTADSLPVSSPKVSAGTVCGLQCALELVRAALGTRAPGRPSSLHPMCWQYIGNTFLTCSLEKYISSRYSNEILCVIPLRKHLCRNFLGSLLGCWFSTQIYFAIPKNVQSINPTDTTLVSVKI